MKTKKKALSWILTLALACSVFNIPLMGGGTAYAENTDGNTMPSGITVQMADPDNEETYLTNSYYRYEMSITDVPSDGQTYDFRVLMDGEAYTSTSGGELSWSIKGYDNSDEVSEDIAEITDHKDGTATVTIKPVIGYTDINVIATYTPASADEDAEPLVDEFDLYGNINGLDVSVEAYDPDENRWNTSLDLGMLDASNIPASGKDYQLRVTIDGKEYTANENVTLEWSLIGYSYDEEGDRIEGELSGDIAALKSDANGAAVLTIKPVSGYQWLGVKAAYDPDGGEGTLEAITDDLEVSYEIKKAYNNVYYAFYGETKTAAVEGTKAGWNGVIPNTVTDDRNITYAVTEIRGLAQYDEDEDWFGRTIKLSALTIPASVTYVDEYAFNYIKGLAAINVDARNTQYMSVDGVLYDKAYEIWDYSGDEPNRIGTYKRLLMYPAAKAGARYEIPADVQRISDGAFGGAGRYNLRDLVIPAGLDLTDNDTWLFRKFKTTQGGEFISWNIKVWSKGNKTIAAHANKYIDDDTDTPALPWAEYTVPAVAATSKISANLSKDYNTMKVTWSAVAGAAGYEVYYKKGSGSWTSLGTTTGTSLTKSKLSKGAKYQFRVIAYASANGGEIYKSAAKDSKAVYTLKKISGIKVKKSKSKIKVSWKNINGETGYQVYKSTKKNKGFKLAKTVKSAKAKSTTIKVKKNKKYYYKVRAYKTVDGKKIYGPWSSVKSYTLK